MRDPLAISLKNVCKTYRLYGSQKEQLLDVLGLHRLGFGKRSQAKEFKALRDISLDVPKGHRIGIIGRNGAGKTTLLKLICGNFAPTSGTIEVNGNVQALMSMGLGFHPEFTGMDNIRASLHYNGLNNDDYEKAVQDIVEFCELGQFIDQPFKTYSTGMQARLMFATATAVRPDILIIDEVLGAGDAYFIAKCKQRVERLVNSGATMLLVSHSTAQVLELCKEVIWMDQGRVRMQGDALVVVKAYEEYIHGASEHLAAELPVHAMSTGDRAMGVPARHDEASRPLDHLAHVHFQEPHYLPHGDAVRLPQVAAPTEYKFVARGGVSRWDGVGGLRIIGFTIVSMCGETNELMSMQPAKFIMTMASDHAASYECRHAIAVYDHLGRCLLDVASPKDSFICEAQGTHAVEIVFNPLQLGPGEYTISISTHEYASLEIFNATPRYDLLNRSFAMKVSLPESLGAIEAQFYHSAEWLFHETTGIR